jgi:hypothetical protein
MKPVLPQVTLICADTTDKFIWSQKAISKSIYQCEFGEVKLISNNRSLFYCTDKIPPIIGLDGYSKFCIREMHKYVETSHALVVQYDGFVLNGQAWSDAFLKFDYIGAVMAPSGIVGNGGFSLRSRKLMKFIAAAPWEDWHPEDSCICIRHREELEKDGFKFAPPSVAELFATEGRSWNSKEWQSNGGEWTCEFGFHSLLTKLPDEHHVCNIYTHSGDAGDVVYSLATVKALGGGMMFLTPHNKYPYPLNSRWTRMGGEAEWVDNLAPLVEAQPYILKCRYTHGHPASTTHDLNRFRIPWKQRSVRDNDSILKLHMDAFNLPMPTDPWLTVPDPIVVPDKRIVVNRTQRYQNNDFQWTRFIEKFHKQMVFVGTHQEYELLCGMAPTFKFDYYETKNALELARVIAGSKLFVGNQSLPLAIAHGLRKCVIVEEWKSNPNTRIERLGAWYELTEEMLA